MPTLLLVRHGRSTANTSGVLAGRTPGVELDALGAEQARALPDRLSGIALSAVVRSPMLRCRQTLAPLVEQRGHSVEIEERINECDYGQWSGRDLAGLGGEPLMATVQQHPSAAVFPGGESMRVMQQRAVEAVRDWNARIEAEHGADAVYLMCSHGDIIKSVVADALGMHLDLFQRIAVETCSVTAVRYTPMRPYVVRLGETGDLGPLAPPAGASAPAESGRGGSDGEQAVVGGGR